MQGSTVKYWRRHARRQFTPDAYQWEPRTPRQVRSRRRAGVFTRLPFGVYRA